MKQRASSSAFSKFRNTFIGDREFYVTVFALVLPLIVTEYHLKFRKPSGHPHDRPIRYASNVGGRHCQPTYICI